MKRLQKIGRNLNKDLYSNSFDEEVADYTIGEIKKALLWSSYSKFKEYGIDEIELVKIAIISKMA